MYALRDKNLTIMHNYRERVLDMSSLNIYLYIL